MLYFYRGGQTVKKLIVQIENKRTYNCSRIFEQLFHKPQILELLISSCIRNVSNGWV
jgi:hypothetical protein